MQNVIYRNGRLVRDNSNRWLFIALAVFCFIGYACAESHEVQVKYPSRDEVVEAALVGWSHAGYTDPRDVDHNKVDTLQIRRAATVESYDAFCDRAEEPWNFVVSVKEERYCIYWSAAEGSFPVVLLREDVPDEDWGEVALHAVLHYFIYAVLQPTLGEDSFDKLHRAPIWGPDGAEEVGRWEL